MPTYVCRVGMGDGAIVTRAIEAPDESALKAEVARLGARLFSVKLAGGEFAPGAAGGARSVASVLSGLVPRRGRPVKTGEFLVFNQELATLLKAGMPLVQSLDILRRRITNPVFKVVLDDVYDRVRAGSALSEAFEVHGALFPGVYTASLLAGEKSGNLEQVLRRYVSYVKVVSTVRRRTVSALVYPAILVALSLIVVTVIVVKVVPEFGSFYNQFGKELPLSTRVIVGVSTFVTTYFILIVGGMAGAAVSVWWWLKQPGQRRRPRAAGGGHSQRPARRPAARGERRNSASAGCQGVHAHANWYRLRLPPVWSGRRRGARGSAHSRATPPRGPQ